MDSKRTRLDKLVAKFAGGKKAELARRLELSRQGLNTWYLNESIDFEKVYYTFPGISSEWLLTGEGEMMQEDRLPSSPSNAQLIPFLSEESLSAGKWDDRSSYIICKGVKSYSSFITRIPNGDLNKYFGIGNLIFCQIVRCEDFKEEHLYIIKTQSGILFMEYIGNPTDSSNRVYRFTTRRPGEADMKIEIPALDIIQSAEISVYTRTRFVDDLL